MELFDTLQKSKGKVFLGGTCVKDKEGNTYRDYLIPLLDIDYFNPVVKNWTAECQAEEIKQREECDYVLYVITPEMKGVYSIAEVVDDSNKRPEKTIFCFNTSIHNKTNFDEKQSKSLEQVAKMVQENGAKFFRTLPEIAEYLNARIEE